MYKSEVVLSEFIQNIDFSSDIDQMFAALENAFFRLGFENVSYTFVPSIIANNLYQVSPVFKISQSYEKEFIKHYSTENLGQHDFTLKRISSGNMTAINWWEESEKNTLNNKEKKLIEIARYDYGIRHGITIPTYSNNLNVAAVSVSSTEKDYLFSSLSKETLSLVKSISQLFNDRVLVSPVTRHHFVIPFLQRLSNTEKRVLALLAQGDVPKEIAFKLDSSPKYINQTISTLRAKFGVKTRDQLLYAAGKIEFGGLDDMY